MSYMILVRHSTTQPQPDVEAHQWPLTDMGRHKAALLANRINQYDIQHIHTSDEPKAVQTAQLIAERIGNINIATDTALRETKRKTAPYYANPADFKQAMHTPDAIQFGEESFTAARTRFEQGLSQILNQTAQGTVLIVSHGTILTLYLAHLTGLDAFTLWNLLDMPAYAVIRRSDNKLCELCLSLPQA